MFQSLLFLAVKSLQPLLDYLVDPDSVKEVVPTLREQSKKKYKNICEHCMQELPDG